MREREEREREREKKEKLQQPSRDGNSKQCQLMKRERDPLIKPDRFLPDYMLGSVFLLGEVSTIVYLTVYLKKLNK